MHVRDEKLIKGKISHCKCTAHLTIYSPKVDGLLKAIILPSPGRPHKHPSFPQRKLTIEAQTKYTQAIHALGIVGATVGKVDNGM